jgi:hypothetical protein
MQLLIFPKTMGQPIQDASWRQLRHWFASDPRVAFIGKIALQHGHYLHKQTAFAEMRRKRMRPTC